MIVIRSSSSLLCYRCDQSLVTTTNITMPAGCSKVDVNDTYCAISIDFNTNGRAYMSIQSETAHQGYGYNEDFVLLGLTIKRNGSYGYGFTYHCLTDGCNEPKLNELQRLLNSTIIEHNIDAILPLLCATTPEISISCARYTNLSNPNECFSSKQKNISCSTCFTTIDGKTNSICSDCLGSTQMISELLVDERAYLLKRKKTSNHRFAVQCNIRECNRIDQIERVRKLYRYDFDYDQFLAPSMSASLASNKKPICFFTVVLLFFNILPA